MKLLSQNVRNTLGKTLDRFILKSGWGTRGDRPGQPGMSMLALGLADDAGNTLSMQNGSLVKIQSDGTITGIGGGASAFYASAFGAKGDGITDDTAAIQAMFDAMPWGATAFFAMGNYKLSAPITISAKAVRIQGELAGLNSSGTRFNRSVDAPAFIVTGSAGARVDGSQMRNLAINGSASFRTDAVRWLYQINSRFENVTINYSGGNGLYLKEVWDSTFDQLFTRFCGKYAGALTVTGSMTSGSPTLTLSAADALIVPGSSLTVAGAVTAARVITVSGTTVTLSTNSGATVSGALVTTTIGKAGLYLEGPETDNNNNHHYNNCDFEHADYGRGIIISPPMPSAAAGQETNQIVWMNTKLELGGSTGRPPPISISNTGNFSFVGCRFNLYANTDNTGTMIETFNCNGFWVTAGLCFNAYTPTGFALLTDTVNARIEIGGFKCGGVSQAGNTRGVWKAVSDTAAGNLGDVRRLLDFAPNTPIDVQRAALTSNTIVDDVNAARGYALRAQTIGGQGAVIWSALTGGAGASGITFYFDAMLAAGSTGGGTFTVRVIRGNVTTVQLSFVATTAGYTRFSCIIPRQLVQTDTTIRILQGNVADVLLIANLGWINGMFGDTVPDSEFNLRSLVTFESGEFIQKYNGFTSGGILGWATTTSGTTNYTPLSGITGAITNGATALVVSSAAGLAPGMYIAVAGAVAISKIVSVSGNNVTLATAATGTATAGAVSYSAPVFKTLGTIS